MKTRYLIALAILFAAAAVADAGPFRNRRARRGSCGSVSAKAPASCQAPARAAPAVQQPCPVCPAQAPAGPVVKPADRIELKTPVPAKPKD